jgi:hypothetical protein
MAPSPQDPVCTTCGATFRRDAGAAGRSADECAAVAAARLTWTRGTELGEVVWTCDRCSRAHLRSIEARLDQAWW